jgi:acyl dehydratase
MKFLEDLQVGDVAELGSHTFTADRIRAFARTFAPLPIHLDEEAARESIYGALTASGWHVVSVWMRYLVEYRARDTERQRQRNEPISENGVSPGFQKLRWHLPVVAGDTITYASTIVNLRASQSRLGWGLCKWRNTGVNQHGELALSFYSSVFVQRRPARGDVSPAPSQP